jgi:hypothetical protein
MISQSLHQKSREMTTYLFRLGAVLTILVSLLVSLMETAQALPGDVSVLSDGTVRAWDATANGTPSGWEQTGFDDSTWSFAQETPCNAYSDWPAPYPGSLWIWYPTCNQTNQYVLFRKHFTLPSSFYNGSLKIHADDGSNVYINGNWVGENNAWPTEYTYDLTPYLIAGENVLAIQGFNTNQIGGGGGPAGITFSATLTSTLYTFAGFFQPVDNLPTLNSAKAGSAIPVKFSLSGDQGLDIFDTGYPKSEQIACDSTANVDGIEATVSAGSSSLSYHFSIDTYTYVWKTEKGWAGTCRQLVVKLTDGTYHRANFKFK